MSVNRGSTGGSREGQFDGQPDGGRDAAEQAVPGAGATSGAGSAAVNQRANTGGEQVPTRIITAGGSESLPVPERQRDQEKYSSWIFAIKMGLIGQPSGRRIRQRSFWSVHLQPFA